jgi:translation elongation factor EF-1alpha
MAVHVPCENTAVVRSTNWLLLCCLETGCFDHGKATVTYTVTVKIGSICCSQLERLQREESRK